MILAVDVQYTGNQAITAGVQFESWNSTQAKNEYITESKNVSKYISGQFYKRELPCILNLIDEHLIISDTIIVDGYVFLDGHTKPGLGKHLFDALSAKVKIIGAAKTGFSGIDDCHAVYRGQSKKPIFVTAIGLELEQAKDQIKSMYGEYRIPTLIKRADQLCRENSIKKLTDKSELNDC